MKSEKPVYKIVTLHCDAPGCDNWLEVRYSSPKTPPSAQPHPCWCCQVGTMQLKAMRVAA